MMVLFAMTNSQGVNANVVQIPAYALFSNTGTTGTVYSGVRFGSDGNLYRRQAAGGWSVFGQWLVNGSASGFYLSRTINSGILTTDAGGGSLQLNTNRDYDVQTAIETTVSANVSFQISDDVSGSPIVAGPTIYNFSATKFSET